MVVDSLASKFLILAAGSTECIKIAAVGVSDGKLQTTREAGAHSGVNAGCDLAGELNKVAGQPICDVVDFVASSDTAKAASLF